MIPNQNNSFSQNYLPNEFSNEPSPNKISISKLIILFLIGIAILLLIIFSIINLSFKENPQPDKPKIITTPSINNPSCTSNENCSFPCETCKSKKMICEESSHQCRECRKNEDCIENYICEKNFCEKLTNLKK